MVDNERKVGIMQTVNTQRQNLDREWVREAVWKGVGEEVGFDCELARECSEIAWKFFRAGAALDFGEFEPDSETPEYVQRAYDKMRSMAAEGERLMREAEDLARVLSVGSSKLAGEVEEVPESDGYLRNGAGESL